MDIFQSIKHEFITIPHCTNSEIAQKYFLKNSNIMNNDFTYMLARFQNKFLFLFIFIL